MTKNLYELLSFLSQPIPAPAAAPAPRPGYGLQGATVQAQAKSPYERTLRPGETRNLAELQDMLGEVILAAGGAAVPGVQGKAATRQTAAGRPRPSKAAAPPVEDYKMQHRPSPDGPRAFDLLEGGIAPTDIYQNPHFFTGYPAKQLKDTMRQLSAARSNPEATVTVYRAAPSGAKLNPGDWVTLSRDYAESHAKHPTDSKLDMPVMAVKVPAKDLRWAMDDLMEFGYFPAGRK